MQATMVNKTGEQAILKFRKDDGTERLVLVSRATFDGGFALREPSINGMDQTWKCIGGYNRWVWDTPSNSFEPGSVDDAAWTDENGDPNITVALPSGRREYLSTSIYSLRAQGPSKINITPHHPRFTLIDSEITEL